MIEKFEKESKILDISNDEKEKGLDVDKPRNLAKSVTVE